MPHFAAPQIGGIVKQVDPLAFHVLECCIRPEPILHCCEQSVTHLSSRNMQLFEYGTELDWTGLGGTQLTASTGTSMSGMKCKRSIEPSCLLVLCL
jgi:hypothetical protein